jgi:hypothetical protein
LLNFRVANKVTTHCAAALDDRIAVLESGSDYLKAFRALNRWRNTNARQAYMAELGKLKAQKSKLNEGAQAGKHTLLSRLRLEEGEEPLN